MGVKRTPGTDIDLTSPEQLGSDVLIPELVGADNSHLPELRQRALSCKDRLTKAANELTSNTYEMALSLYEARVNNYEEEWGISFADFSEQVLKIGYRSAYNLANVGEFITTFEISKEDVERRGITRMREISRYVNALPDSVDKQAELESVMLLPADTTVLDLKEQLNEKKSQFTEAKEEQPDKFRLTSQVFVGDSARRVADAIEQAKADIGGKEDVSAAIEHALMEWVRLRGADAGMTALEDWIKFIEDRYNVRLVRSVEPQDLEVVAVSQVGDEVDLNALGLGG